MRAPALTTLCLAAFLLATPLLHAAAAKPSDSTPAAPKKKAGMPKFIPNSSHESARERERRLLRECKGRPNAGACAGYTG